MKIAQVEAIPVSYPEPNDFNALRHLCLAKITADDGQIGWGESITQFPEANFAAKAIIEGMAPNLIGKDPIQTETLWRQNKQQAWWYGYHGGIASYAVAAIDIALWDLKGKSLGKSVLDLLGGPVHDRLPAIASCHAHYESIPEMAEETAQWVSTGLQGLKTGFGKRGSARLGYDHDRDVAYVKAMRKVLGDKMLMIDNGIAIKWDVTDAVRRAKAMEEYNLSWIEEPLGAWDPEGYANLRAKTTTRIAYGEREWTLEQFERVLATGTSMSSASTPVAPRASRDLRRSPNDANSITGKPTLMLGRRRSSARRAWRFRLIHRLASCSSSSRCAIQCSTIW
jgi:L-alanine-DL-glutamate epimerase-like enolase superfamily enzyme